MNRVPIALAVVALLITGCASRGTVSRMGADVSKLRSELAAVRAAQELASRETARTQTELQALDARTRDLGARIQAASDELSKLDARIGATDDAIRKTREIVDGLATRAAPSTAVRPRAQARDAREPRDSAPESAYSAALATFRSREYGQAVLDFIDFIAKYAGHPLAANAQYWIGEAYYVQRDYRQALAEFQKVLELRAGKVPDALVKVGLCYWNLRDARHARAAWQRVVREHPGAESATVARTLLRTHTASRR